MFREGINRIKADLCLVDMSGKVLRELEHVDLDKAIRLPLELKCDQPGRYRLGLYGKMNLSNGESKPFITKSFPFEIIDM